MTFKSAFYAAALAILTAQPAAALVNGQVDSTMTALIVTTDAEGREILTQANSAAPGDLVEYRMQYTNLGQSRLDGFDVRGPVPEGTQYIAGSAAGVPGAWLEVSVDGGETWESEPVMRWLRDEAGQIKQIIIPPSEYTGVRWRGGSLEAGRSLQYLYRVKVQ